MAKRKHTIEANITTKGAAKTQQDLKKTTDSIKNLAKGVKNAGLVVSATAGIISAGFIKMTKSGAEFADGLAKTSTRLGTTVAELNTLGFAAEQAGADIFAVRTGLRRLSQAQLDAAVGLSAQSDAFFLLGVTVRDVNGDLRQGLEVFKDVATAIANMEDRTLAAALSQKILGRSGDLLLPLLLQGGDGIEKFGEILRVLNAQVSDTEAALGEELVDAMNLVNRAVKGLSVSFLNIFGRTLIDISKLLGILVGRLGKFIEANKDIVLTVGKAAAVIAGIGIAVTVLSTNVILLTSAFTLLLTPMGAAAFALTVIGAATIVATLAMIKFRDQLIPVASLVVNLAGGLAGLGILMRALPGALKNNLSDEELTKLGLNIANVAKGLADIVEGAEGLGDAAKSELEKLQADLAELNVLLAELPRNMGNAAGATKSLLDALIRAKSGVDDLVKSVEKTGPSLKNLERAVPVIEIPAPELEDFQGAVGLLASRLAQLKPDSIIAINAALRDTTETVAILSLEFLNLPTNAAIAADAILSSFDSIGFAIEKTLSDKLETGKLKFKVFAEAIEAEARRLVARLIAIFAVKALFSFVPGIGPIAALLNAGSGLPLPGGAHGGIVTGGTRFQDSVPILAQAGERIIPAENSLDSFLGEGGGVNPTMVNFNNSILLGSEAEFNEFSRKISQSQNFNEFGLFE